MSNSNLQKRVFDASSPGFLYTVIVSILTVLGLANIEFPAPADQIAGEIVTALNGTGFFAVISILIASVLFPIWNAWQKGDITFKGIFSNTLTWVSLANILFGALALWGFSLPSGTVEQIINAVFAKDWSSLISIVVTTVIPTIVRFIKDRK